MLCFNHKFMITVIKKFNLKAKTADHNCTTNVHNISKLGKNVASKYHKLRTC